MHVIDGMHRLRAAQLRGQVKIDVIVLGDTDGEAFIRSISANARHGLPLTLRDRKAAAARLLGLYPDRSDRAVAELAGLSGKTVGALRRSIAHLPQLPTRMGRDGRVRAVDRTSRSNAVGSVAGQPEPTPAGIGDIGGTATATGAVLHEPAGGNRITLHQPEPEGRIAVAPRVTPDHPQPRDILANLTRDPSLRYSEAGRSLLRWLHWQPAVGADSWAHIISAIPVHCLPAIARLSQSYAADWRKFGQRIEQRIQLHDSKAS
jgi:hypothetical protein